MSTLIVAFPKLEEAKAVRNLLIHRGFDVAVPCTSGAQAINQADTLSDGIIICGYKLSDNMVYTELYEYKPKSFEMLLVASQNRWEDCQDNGIVCAAMPIKVNDLVSTIEMMLQAQIRRRKKLRSQPPPGTGSLEDKTARKLSIVISVIILNIYLPCKYCFRRAFKIYGILIFIPCNL
jgi:two-component system, response regulator PdtaR